MLIGPTESPISYAREKELAELGFTPVVESVDGRVVVNLTLTPYQDESLDRTGIRRAHTGFAADLRGLLCACRFAHGIARLAPRSSERVLQNWLDSYVALPDRLPDATRPLRAASVHLEQVHNKTFSGVAALSIWPAHQFDASEPLDLRVRIKVLYPRPTETEESFPADPTAASRAEVNKESHQPFQLLSAAPCRESHAALEAFWRSLEGAALPQCQMAFAPLTVELVVDATRPIEELVEWVCREDWRLDIEIADAPHGAALDLPRLGFLARYPSGIVRGLAAEIESVEGRYRLTILDPLALLDPGGLVPTRPTEPLPCRFDVLVLEATAMIRPELGVVQSGAELVHAREQRWLVPGDVSGPLVVFVHGFTAHGRYLAQLAGYVGSQNYVAALFNYDSYLGIERAANDLEFLLEGLDDVLGRYGFVLVGHSMGGLVSRHFAEYSRAQCRNALKGVATLGTPHKGAVSRRLVHRMLDWADAISVPNPFARSIACVASRQLIDTSANGLIAQMNSRSPISRVPMLSVSGGLPFLELGWGDRGFVGMLRNIVLQRLIGEQPNDGLVAESSSDITQVAGGSANGLLHRRDYPAYQTTNHTYLSQNQQIGQLLHTWLRGVLPIRQPEEAAGVF